MPLQPTKPFAEQRTRAAMTLWVFLKLGLTSFGGPVAHLGYFHDAFVRRRGWLDEHAFADLVTLCQLLPGPTSSQIGFAIGWMRAGPLGAVAAWIGFTLPSALLMIAFAFSGAALTGDLGNGLIHGLKLVAVAVVAQAVFGMARTLTPDFTRLAIAVLAGAIVNFASAFAGQVISIMIGALMGAWLCREQAASAPTTTLRISRRLGLAAATLFALLLFGGPLVSATTGDPAVTHFNAFYSAGALVFGGGHVVLPLLQHGVVTPGWMDGDAFLAGYGAAQALPGPLFAFAAYLGAAIEPAPNGVVGAMLGLAGIFLPGLLALIAVAPFWNELRQRQAMQAAIRGANAAVVGILALALYKPVWISTVGDTMDIVVATTGFAMLTWLRMPPIVVVVLGAAFGILSAA